MKQATRKILAVLGAASVLALTGCATHPADPDPYESVNRKVFEFNRGVDRYVLLPVTKGYRFVVPEIGREGVSNVFQNLGEPANTVNHVLQGEADDAVATTFRFLVNTTFGLGGLFDVASWIGNEPRPDDFGQTLAKWGVPQGSYLMIPLLGPATTRSVGQIPLSIAANPTSYLLADESFWAKAGVTGAAAVDQRNKMIDSGVDDMLENVIDPYVALRNAYLQHRRHLTEPESAADGAGTSGLIPLPLDDED